MEKLILTASLTGEEFISKMETPYVPCTIGELDLVCMRPWKIRNGDGALAIMMRGYVRMGMEDNIYLEKGVLARATRNSWQKIARIVEDSEGDRSPDEARKILG